LGELKSKHEVSQVAWMSFHNSLVHQLNLTDELREDPSDFIASVKTTYDRLFEISPMLHRSFMTNIRKRVEATASPGFQIPCYLNGYKHSEAWTSDCEYEENSVNELREEVELIVQEV
jgi:hypothetical protein